jgi:isopenicillin N synthase-like dioxygenase
MTAAADTEALCTDLLGQGFGYLPIGSEIAEVIRSVFKRATDFFELPLAEKLTCQLPNDAGFHPFGVEYSGSADRPDPIESFTATARLPIANLPRSPDAAHALYGEMLRVFDALERLAEDVVIVLASRVSGIDQRTALSGSLRRWSSLQVNQALPVTPESVVHPLHEDGHLLTLAFATAPGLEIDCGSDALVPIPPSGDHAVVMPGEIAALLSAGLIPPLFHRVVRCSEAANRMALLFFVDIDPRLCRPWRTGPAHNAIDIGQRVLKNATRFGRKPFDLE